MPFISQSSIQELTERVDAVGLASDYVKLEKRGGRFWACCPFHQEKTASFTVNPDLKTYYCFGCHKGGSVINFVMEMDKISFPEAVELLAKRFGVELVYANSGDKDFSDEEEAKRKIKEELFELYNRISGTFHHFLLKKPEAVAAKRYIIDRGICIETIERFGLGYSPADRQWLHRFLSRKGFSEKFLASSGLFSSRHPQASLFSGRLMFPIADRQGRTVAFGGRFLPGEASVTPGKDGWEPPKYINSPESGIYKKGETLYAVDQALPEIRRTKTAVLAEGYMDVIALHQAGISNAVAPLGTAFTEEQAKLLKRWAEKVILFFDSDEAGKAAALKGIYTCRKIGLACAIVYDGKAPAEKTDSREQEAASKDPADILRYYGQEVLQKRAKSFINDFEYLLAQAGTLYDVSASGGKAQAVAFLFPYLNILGSEVARDSCIELAADSFGLLPAVIADDYRRYATGRRPVPGGEGINPRKEEISRETDGKTPIRINNEISLLIAVAVDYLSSGEEKLFPKFRSALEISEIEDPNAKEIFIALEECIRYGETGTDEFLARIQSQELKGIILQRSASGEFSVNSGQIIADGIKKIKEKRLKHRQEEIIVRLRSLKKAAGEERNTDDYPAEERELLSEKMRIDEELFNLKQGKQV